MVVVALGLSSLLLFGCEEEKPTYVPPEPVSDFEAFKKLATVSRYSQKQTDWLIEVCQALAATARFDSGARREILKDYDFDLATITKVEAKIDKLFGYTLETSCGVKLPLIILGEDQYL